MNSAGSSVGGATERRVDLRERSAELDFRPSDGQPHQGAVRVLVVEDHPHTREGICDQLGLHDRMEVLGGYPSIESVPLPFHDNALDVVVLDLSIRDGQTGIDNVSTVLGWGAAVVVHTGYSTEIVRDACVKHGAKGFVGKDASIDELPRVIRAAAMGRYGEAGVEYLDLRAPLTDAGKRVLAHLTEASGSGELASRLSHSSSYVDNLISTLMIKTDCHTRAQLAAWAVRHGCHLLIGSRERV